MCRFEQKNIFMRKLSVVFIALCALFSSCGGDKCAKVQCGVNQICNSGNCFCNDGYEGTNCDVLSSPKYIGNYLASEVCNNGSGGLTYYPNIQQQSSRPSELQINNFINQFTITAYIRGDASKTGNNIEIPEQQLGGSGTIYGQGVYSPYDRRITINLEYTLNFQNKACTHTFYPQ